PPSADGESPRVRRDVDVEVNGRRYAVALWVPDVPVAAAPAAGGPAAARPRRAAGAASSASVAGSGKVTVPMQGTITKVLVSVGDTVEAGQAVCVLEAMKMENNINADKAGTVTPSAPATSSSSSSDDRGHRVYTTADRGRLQQRPQQRRHAPHDVGQAPRPEP